MIIKKLRLQNHWSQEQLAQFSCLSSRTIQRIESGNQASIESLKSLAAVFEIDISKLTEEITVIDKQTEQWRNLPFCFRANMWGLKSKKEVERGEFLLVVAGTLAWLGGFFDVKFTMVAPVFFLSAYMFTLLIRTGEKYEIW